MEGRDEMAKKACLVKEMHTYYWMKNDSYSNQEGREKGCSGKVSSICKSKGGEGPARKPCFGKADVGGRFLGKQRKIKLLRQKGTVEVRALSYGTELEL